MGRRYRNPTGFPSVTQILKPYLPSDFFTQESRDRGVSVHAAAGAYLRGLWVPPLPKEHIGYFDSFRRWADLRVDRVVMVERRLVDPGLGLSGQPDAVVVLRGDPDDVLTLGDLKTSAVDQKWWRLQIAGYRELIHRGFISDEDGKPAERAGIKTARGGSIRAKADGSTAKWSEYSDTFKSDFNFFLSALNIFNFFEGQ